MLNSILILLTSTMLMGCVVSPDWNTGVGVGVGVDTGVGVNPVDGSLLPRVHVGSRTGLSVWLHPNYVVADAYTVAAEHCSRFGLNARPARNWDIFSNRPRYLDYTCVSYRPVLAFPHIIVNHDRYINRPWHRRWYHRRYGRYYRRGMITPKPRHVYHRGNAKRKGWWGVNRPSKDRYKRRRGVGRTYTPKPTSRPKRNGWWGGNNTRPLKDRYRSKSYKSYKTVKTSKPNKWSKRFDRKDRIKTNNKWSSKKTVTTKSAYTKPKKSVVVTKKKVVSSKEKYKRPGKKSFFGNKTKKSKFETKKASKKKSWAL